MADHCDRHTDGGLGPVAECLLTLMVALLARLMGAGIGTLIINYVIEPLRQTS